MPTFGAISACINVGGTSLPEYGVQTNEAQREVTCWIPSEVGKNFSISWHSTNLLIDTEGSVILDGRNAGSLITRKYSLRRPEFASEYISPTTCRDFSFAPIKYTDDDWYLGVPTQDVGNIQLTIYRIELGEVDAQFNKLHDAPDVTLHERSKKLGAHYVQFGHPRNATPITFYKTNKLEILARFIFRYHSIDILRANGVAPPVTRQEPVKSDGQGRKRKDWETLEAIEIKPDPNEDILDRVTRPKDLESRRVKKRKVKTENRVPTLVDNEVIDLT